jgi:transcriptional regulator with XRE-family HTH domain
MFGERLKDIRIKHRISIDALSSETGIAIEDIAAIEKGHRSPGDRQSLVALAYAASHNNTYDHCELFKHIQQERRFHAYGIGAGRTGTRSLALILNNYRSKHQFGEDITHAMITNLHNNVISPAKFRNFIRKRDIDGFLEMDSTMHTIFYLDILLEEFPSALFICLVRDCYSWLTSVVNMLTYPENGFDAPGDYSFPELKQLCLNDKNELLRNIEHYIDKPLRFWRYVYKTVIDLKNVYPSRFIVINTHELTDKLPEIASFLKIPHESLNASLSHEGTCEYQFSILHEVDPQRLRPLFVKHCADVMDHYLPGYTLDEFLHTFTAQPFLI